MATRLVVDGATELTSKFTRANPRARAALADALRETGRALEGKVKNAVRSKMRVRSGMLMRSIGHTLPDDLTLEVGILAPQGKVLEYAGIQEFGGTIQAKSARFAVQNVKGKPLVGPFLKIPVGKNLTPAGVSRDLRGFVIRSKAGNYVGVQIDGSGNLEVIFALKSSVTIRPKGYLIPTVTEATPTVRAFLEKKVLESLEAA